LHRYLAPVFLDNSFLNTIFSSSKIILKSFLKLLFTKIVSNSLFNYF
jgi:hypothetical protein